MKCKFFLIILIIFSCKKNSPPVIGNPEISIISKAAKKVHLEWNPAKDEETASENLKYLLIFSKSNNISNYADIEKNGTVLKDWSNITSFNADLPEYNDNLFFNVAVKDDHKNITVYKTKFVDFSDNISPNIPNKNITTASKDSKSFKITFLGATDDKTDKDFLVYSVFKSLSDNLNAPDDFIVSSNKSKIREGIFFSFQDNITADEVNNANLVLLVEGLSADTSYFVNVVVRDLNGNRSVWDKIEIKTDKTANLSATELSFNAVSAITWTLDADKYVSQEIDIAGSLWNLVDVWATNSFGTSVGQSSYIFSIPKNSLLDIQLWCNALTEYYNSQKSKEASFLNCIYFFNDNKIARFDIGKPVMKKTGSGFFYDETSWSDGLTKFKIYYKLN